MSIEVLRRAATQARAEAETQRAIAPHLVDLYGDDCGANLHALRDDAVADWLDHEADRMESPDIVQVAPGEVRRALAVAHAYLGGDA